MTIIIPIWLIILIICAFIANSIYRANQLIKGAKVICPAIRNILDPETSFDIKISKTNEDSSTR